MHSQPGAQLRRSVRIIRQRNINQLRNHHLFSPSHIKVTKYKVDFGFKSVRDKGKILYAVYVFQIGSWFSKKLRMLKTTYASQEIKNYITIPTIKEDVKCGVFTATVS